MSPRARSGAGHAADEHFILPRDRYKKQSDNGNPLKKSTPAPVTIQHVLKALEETNEERDIRIHKLFNLFDVTNTGHLENYAQIEAGLSAFGKPTQHNTKYAKDIFLACDANQDGQVDYQEFRRYVDDKELELYRIFQAIDIELDGCISFKQLSQALAIAGIEINEEELACFIDHVAKDNNGTIFFEEWRDFLLFYPHEATIKNIYQYLESACPEDMSDSPLIPEDITKDTSKYLMLGGIAGATSRTATAPLDRIKVLLQVQTSHARIVPAVKDIWREGGFRAFFRGNGLNVLKVAPETAIRFYTYEMMKNFIHYRNAEDRTSDITTVERLIAGGTAGALAQTIIYPMDLMKTRLQTYAYERGKYIKLDVLLWFIWIQEGPRAFYRGLVPSLIGIIPFAAIDFAAYEALKDISRTYAFNGEPGPLIQVGCGTISGALGASCVYPLQVIRTRMQAQRTNAAAAYKGMSDVFWRTLQHEGFRGFYKGILPNLLKVVPSASITYLVFETMKRGLDL